MAFIAAAAIGGGLAAAGGIAGSIIQGNAADKAAQMQAQAAGQANQNLDKVWQEQQANNQPWMQAGTGALSQMSGMTQNAPSFTAQDFQNNMDPAYQFDLQQGQQALERSAAARGGLQTGGTLKALTDYAQGQASNEYQNSYNRFMNNQNTQFGRLSAIAGMGQNATLNTNAMGSQYATDYGNNLMGGANAQGGAAIAKGNAWAGTLSSLGSGIGSNLMQGAMVSKLAPQGYGGAGAGAVGYGSSMGSAMAPVQPYQSSAFGQLSGD